jgi:hypothetical protein
MGCTGGIAKAITSDCTTSKVGGLETVAWAFNRKELEITYSVTTEEENQITGLVNASGKQGYKLTGVKKLFNAGHDIVVADDRPNKYSHHFMMQVFEGLTADIRNADDLDDMIIVVEKKDKETGGDGTFLAYGCKYGLFKTTDTQRANDINGARNIELASLPGQEEPFASYVVLDTDYATTLALLEDLVTNPGS